MSNAVNNLKDWFYNKLSAQEQEEVVDFLYQGERGEVLLREGLYYGPKPNVIEFGLHLGPKPTTQQSSNICPTCKRPF